MPRRLMFALACLLSLPSYADEFPAPYNSEPDSGPGPLKPETVAAEMQLPPGFRANVFAAEPEVQNPIGIDWDGRGRLWVAENYTYAEAPLRFELKLRDRLVILADTDGDGRADERKVFTDDLQMLTSVAVGLGGVWVMCPPQLLFIPDLDRDDRPDGPAQVILDGFRVPPENYHNFANGLRFGPDGWLYGRCGASSPGEVGRPGVPEEERIPLRGTMWRYSPHTKVFEALSSGTTNPWGHDWDENGELFFINTVNGHLWHGITGAHFTRPHTVDPNPRVYELIDTHADHWHFDVEGGWQKSRDGAANSLGGGHAHIGCCILQGRRWPAEYRGRLLTLNMHGLRANTERLEREGSGYVGRHEPDLFIVKDPWFRGMELSEGPDGALYVADWSDTGECHERNGVHRTSGRIYRISYDDEPAKPVRFEAGSLTLPQLVELQLRGEEWFVRQARLELESRMLQRRDMSAVVRELQHVCNPGGKASDVLKALWTLQALHQNSPRALETLLSHRDEHVRAWAVRLLVDDSPLDTTLSERPAGAAPGQVSDQQLAVLVDLAQNDPSALVRLTLASALQRLTVVQRLRLAVPLMAHAEDAGDHNLPLMIWYGLIPVADHDPLGLARAAADCKLPTTRRLIARRLAEDVEDRPAALELLLRETVNRQDGDLARDVVQGVAAALIARRKAPQPAGWDAFVALASQSGDEGVRNSVRDLSVLFGDGRALSVVKEIALDSKASLPDRQAALATLIDARPAELREICEKLLGVRFLNPVAARGLSLFDDDKAAAKLVASYKSFHHSQRAELIAVLAGRPRFASALLVAVAEDKIPRSDLTAFVARQIHDFADPRLDQLLTQTWGEFRDSPAEKKELIAKLKAQLTPDVLAQGDRSAGRALFAKTCTACHKFFGEGKTAGPDLTGANRSNLDYLLENIVDPSAVVSADFRMTVLALEDGRVLNGLVLSETGNALTLRTATDTVAVDLGDVEERKTVPLSLMPENLLQPYSLEQIRDLFAYLMTREQVPLPQSE
ncbi:PVC-type heme-binding CxxCH protein [Planctellipticum variicoloris]|uniref:PVC-type heme-binding CxxCH protein n=1 Tax=Planctellipticum variicoloris TaxID=3064265 RepID=UPI00301376E0|nr:c-type cytochrome [Planctomycetaceae bacterium SH412]